MLNVIAINSSNRRKNTFGLISQVQTILKDHQINVEVINLYWMDIKDCIGCEQCILTDECVFKADDVGALMDKIKNSDGIILTSPVYLQAVSGKLKTLIDRTCKWFHRPEIYGKPVLVIATTKGSGLKATLNYLESVVVQWGAINAGKIGRDIKTIENPVTERECRQFITHLKTDEKDYKPRLDSLINFQVQKNLADFLGGLDGVYWREKGWDQKLYYFDCYINWLKQIPPRLIGEMMERGMKKTKASQNLTDSLT